MTTLYYARLAFLAVLALVAVCLVAMAFRERN